MVQPAQDRLRDYVSKPLDRPRAGRILPQRNMGSRLIVVRRIFRKNAPKVLGVGKHSRRIDPIRRSTCPFCQGDRSDVGLSRIPIARTRALNTAPNARSLSRTRYFGVVSHGNASVICRANHSAVGLRVTANHSNCRRLWPRTRNAKSCGNAMVGHKQINRRNPLRMIANEGLPGLQWPISSGHHVNRNGRLGDFDAELEQTRHGS